MATTQSRPDGRPLYAYKWHDAHYERLKTEVCAQMPGALCGKEAQRFPAMFCVYAAETFRRRHAGGPWTWETVFAEIGYAIPEYQTIYQWVAKGLQHFQRPLLRSRNGDREFLVTLACEGGLPLQLLHKENSHLSRYFRELLTAYHRVRHTSGCDATSMAQQVAARYLPASLRHDIVFHLSSELIQAVVRLQEQVADATDPIASLDYTQPQWRHGLPLPIDDATVETLLRNLIGQARILAQTERQRWRWHGLLIQQGEHWTLAQHLDMPNTVTGSSVYAWTQWPEPSARMRVLLHTAEGIETIALWTRLHGSGEQAIYRCEGLRRGGVRLMGNVAAAGARLLLSSGNAEVELPMVGGQTLGPLPWVFIERDGQWQWCGEGSVRSREATVRVLVPEGGQWLENDGTANAVGSAPEVQRLLYQINGALTWDHPDLGMCQFRCASQDASAESWRLQGPVLRSVLNVYPPFVGMPRLYTLGHDEEWREVRGSTLEWRSLDAPESAWQTDSAGCAGRVWIRWRDASGALRLRRQAEVVPATTQVTMTRVGTSATQPGTLHLTGLPGVQVTVPDVAQCCLQQTPLAHGVALTCFAEAGLPVTQFPVALHWPDGRTLELQLPLPYQGAAFVAAGVPLSPGARVALGRLASVQAIVRTPTGSGRFYLSGHVQTRMTNVPALEVREWLEPTHDGHYQVALHRLQEHLTSVLAMTGDLDAMAILELLDGIGRRLTHLEVALYDMQLERDATSGRVVLPPACLDRLEDGWEQRLNVTMLRLWAPATEPIDLVRDAVTMSWWVPEDLEPGPWWVLGSDGHWPRFRPLLWVAPGPRAVVDVSDLVQAICEHDMQRRQAQLAALVQALALDAEHADWPRLFDYLGLTRTYPASAFDILRHLARVPEAMVLALIQSPDAEFDLVWSLANHLPFSWHLVPVTAWLHAAQRYVDALRAGLGDNDPDGAMLWGIFREFRERVTNRQPFFKSVCDWIGERLFPTRRMANSELAMVRHDPSMVTTFIAQAEQALQERHGADERYPDGPGIMARVAQPDFPAWWLYEHLAYPFRSVRCAPFVAAQISLGYQTSDEALGFELQQSRDFDLEWFDHTFAYALCLGLAQRPVAVEGTQP